MLKDIIKKFRSDRRFLRNVIVSISLLTLWLFLTVWYVVTFDTSFSIWSYNHPNSDIANVNYNLIQRNETFKGKFRAQDNNLGIVSIRFQTYIRPPYSLEDQYLFKIKEKNAKGWYYQNIYRSGLIYDVPFFPFGFPQIANSKGKTYDFEITALNTNSVNQLSISTRYPILQSKYKYSGHELLENRNKLLKFLIVKFTNAFQTPDVIFSSFIYFLPFLFYPIWIAFLERLLSPFARRFKKIIKRLENTHAGPLLKFFEKIFIHNLDNVLVSVVLIDILTIQLNNDVAYLVITALWIVTLKVYKKGSSKSFVVGLVLIALCPLFLAFRSEPTAEQSGAWAFMFLVAGTIQILLEQRKASKLDYEARK
jgi:hypothetical protein